MCGRPERGQGNAGGCDFCFGVPGGQRFLDVRDGFAGRIGDFHDECGAAGKFCGVIEAGLHFDRGRGARNERWCDVYRFQRDRGHIGQMNMTVEAAIEAEVAQVGGRALKILRVVAENGDGNALFGRRRGCNRIGNVEHEFVVSTHMRADHRAADIDVRSLPGTFEIEQCTAILDGVGDGQMGAIPAVTAIIRRIGIAGVIFVEAMRQRNFFPDRDLVAAPNLPGSVECAAIILPPGVKTLGGRASLGVGENRTHERCRQREFPL